MKQKKPKVNSVGWQHEGLQQQNKQSPGQSLLQWFFLRFTPPPQRQYSSAKFPSFYSPLPCSRSKSEDVFKGVVIVVTLRFEKNTKISIVFDDLSRNSVFFLNRSEAVAVLILWRHPPIQGVSNRGLEPVKDAVLVARHWGVCGAVNTGGKVVNVTIELICFR